MPGSDDRDRRPTPPGRARQSAPEAASQLPPTVMTEIEVDDFPEEATHNLGTPPTDPDGAAAPAEPFLGGSSLEGGIPAKPTDPPPPYIASRDVATPRGLTPPPRTASELAQQPAPDRRERATAQRTTIARGAVFTAIGAAVALGISVIVLHITGGGEPEDGPILIVATAAEAPAAPAAPAPSAQPTVPIDRSASIEELERLGARHLASGNRIDAAAVYRVLAERAPHRRAFRAAARSLTEDAR